MIIVCYYYVLLLTIYDILLPIIHIRSSISSSISSITSLLLFRYYDIIVNWIYLDD